jgi:hypothetical protein
VLFVAASAREFAAKHDIPEKHFYSWIARFEAPTYETLSDAGGEEDDEESSPRNSTGKRGSPRGPKGSSLTIEEKLKLLAQFKEEG